MYVRTYGCTWYMEAVVFSKTFKSLPNCTALPVIHFALYLTFKLPLGVLFHLLLNTLKYLRKSQFDLP
jgi:fumarate reductase subunit C